MRDRHNKSRRLERALQRRRKSLWTLTPWLRWRGTRYAQECRSRFAWYRYWIAPMVEGRTIRREVAGRVWLNGDGLEIRSRWYTPPSSRLWFSEGGNGNGVAVWSLLQWTPDLPRPWVVPPHIAQAEYARQRAEVDAQLSTLLCRVNA